MANIIVDTVRSAHAESPETAKSTSELEEKRKGFGKCAAFLLKKHSSLRRYVKCTADDVKLDFTDAKGTTHIDKRKKKTDDSEAVSEKAALKAAKKAAKKAERAAISKRNKLIEKSFSYKERRLTGEEKWYIEPENADSDGEAEAARERLPYLLRDGAEPKIVSVIVGCLALAVLGEVIVYYLPTIMDFFVKLADTAK
ncbi:MAG: hypothetical protein IKM46_02095 [Clostridia bacterium]|nr:hypothetical protein [Clostridia bacterium]